MPNRDPRREVQEAIAFLLRVVATATTSTIVGGWLLLLGLQGISVDRAIRFFVIFYLVFPSHPLQTYTLIQLPRLRIIHLQ
ncbi:hypothetical protein BD410DRAFT_792011 [Rickenella mellea]|uniref:Uncharacterized protein n=1 Tax=Rickenella mellea TaxID=50990 RepID=A0A4Y7PW44_9AGAM|nr:hypothetical protein BD410DRAFT_792011 [Rickenella mellea]